MKKRSALFALLALLLLACSSLSLARAGSAAAPDTARDAEGPSAQAVVFRLVPPQGMEVGTVSVRGSFNGWGETPMSRQDDGSWAVTLDLAPGEYQYKFFIDGKWPPDMERGFGGIPFDADANGYVPDGYGGRNAVRTVGAGAAVAARPGPAELAERMDAMKKHIARASIAVYPIIAGNEAMPKVAELVALFLERSGLKDIEVMEQAFNVSAQSDIWSNARVFGTFVCNSSIEADYALLGEFRDDCNGPGEIRCIVVDRDGQPVWVDGHAPPPGQFNPMLCTHLMVDRLRTRLGLPSAEREDAPEGRWAEHWRVEAGAPLTGEFARMEERFHDLRASFAEAKVWVFPIREGEKSDREGAATLAKLLKGKGLCQAEAAPVDIRVDYGPAPNEQRMLWDLARGFRERVRETDIEADYALYAEYFFDPRTQRAHAVHFVLCDAAGEWVIVDLQNSHHDDFKGIDPATADDCGRLVLKRIQSYLAEE